MWLKFLYEMGLWLALFAVLPKVLFQYLFQGKYRNSLASRFGRRIPRIDKKGRPLVWIHAVSLGETVAVAALARRIKEELRNPHLVISSATETGYAEAKRLMPFADHHLYLPFDLRGLIKRLFKRISPDLVIITESDFWLNFLEQARKKGARLVVVNGKMSERSSKRYQRWHCFGSRLFSLFDLICVQSEEYAARFISSGADPMRIRVTGNLKFDDMPVFLSPEERARWRCELGIDQTQPVITVGSTHDPEEREILKAFEQVWCKFPGCQLIMAPRHPGRFAEVAALLDKLGIGYRSYSQRGVQVGLKQVVLIDAMGLLRCCYQLADVAIVAGSYTPKVGGHNILEPCIYGVPVLFGPFMQSQPELRRLVLKQGAGIEVGSAELGERLIDLLSNPAQRSELGEAGRRLMKENAGATLRTWSLIKGVFSSPAASVPAANNDHASQGN